MMDLGKIKEIMMRELALFISISVVLVSCIISLAWYYVLYAQFTLQLMETLQPPPRGRKNKGLQGVYFNSEIGYN